MCCTASSNTHGHFPLALAPGISPQQPLFETATSVPKIEIFIHQNSSGRASESDREQVRGSNTNTPFKPLVHEVWYRTGPFARASPPATSAQQRRFQSPAQPVSVIVQICVHLFRIKTQIFNIAALVRTGLLHQPAPCGTPQCRRGGAWAGRSRSVFARFLRFVALTHIAVLSNII